MYEREATAGEPRPPLGGRHFKRNPRWASLFWVALPRTVFPFFSLFSSCPPLLCSPEVLPLTDPSYVSREKNRKNANVGFQKKTACTSLKIYRFLAALLSFLFFLSFCITPELFFSLDRRLKVWHCGIKVHVLVPGLCFCAHLYWMI